MIDGDAELLAYYLATADARVERFEAAIKTARSDQGDQARDVLRQVVHRLAGSAGTYGFAALTKTARALEARLGPGNQLDDAAVSAAVSLLDDMKRAFAAARREVQNSAASLDPELDAASEVELAASGHDEAEIILATPSRAAQPAAARPSRVIVTPPPEEKPREQFPLVALFVGKGVEQQAQASARAVAAALAQAGVGLICCGEGPCLAAVAQGYAENAGGTFRLEARAETACAESDAIVLLRGTSLDLAAARGKPMVRANTHPLDSVVELLELLARAEFEAAA